MLTAVVILLVVVCCLWYGAQGLFTGLIHSVSATLALLFAFALYEPLNHLILSRFEAGLGISFVLVFAVFLGGLRFLLEWLVQADIRLEPPIANKAAGAVLALPGGIIMAGAFLIGLQMMPFGPGISDYVRYAPGQCNPSVEKQEPATLPLNADGFTLGLASLASNNGLGGTAISSVHANLLDDLFLARDRVQLESRMYASPEGLLQALVYQADARVLADSTATKPAGAPKALNKILIVRATFDPKLLGDEDQVIRFKPQQVRLMLTDGRILYPFAITDSPANPALLKKVAGISSPIKVLPSGQVTLEFGFENPGITSGDDLRFFEFKSTARAIPAMQKVNPLTEKDLGIKELSFQ